MFDIKEELKKLPDSPGCYLHKDEFGQIIYVGKAISLRNRVRQYFQSPAGQTPKTRELVKHIAEFEYITAGSEMEALILECNLIKKYRPKYNILLRDDKTYPYIKLTLGETYPRVLKTRKLTDDGSRYFGPYADAGAVNTTIDLVNSAFCLKRCPDRVFSQSHRPCLNYHIGQCPGICTGNVSPADYGKRVSAAMDFLSGKDRNLEKQLRKKMEEASDRLEFEEAARLRDCIKALETLEEKQRVVLSKPENLNIILIVKGLAGAHAVLFSVSEGKLSGRESFFLGETQGESVEGLLAEFIKRYYAGNVVIPREILLPVMPEDSSLISDWLSELRGSRVVLNVPERGEKRALMDVVLEDARMMLSYIDEKTRRQQERDASVRNGLIQVFGDEIGRRINRIESYDISNIMGMDSVGAMVVFEDGAPLRNAYRRFKIKTLEGPDDTGAMTEVLFRRFKRGIEGDPAFSVMPDALFMDGGAGQVSAAEAVLGALKLDIPVAGMVKDDKHRTRAILFRGVETPLKGMPQLFSFAGAIQEEVHRFAIDYHHSLRGKSMSKSVLDEIPGIGEKRKLALLSSLGSVEAIKNADVSTLASVPGMNLKVAEQVSAYFCSSAKKQKPEQN